MSSKEPEDDSTDSLSDVLSRRYQLNGICDRFEKVWQSGNPPDIARFLPEKDTPEDLVKEILGELLLIDAQYREKNQEPWSVEFSRAQYPVCSIPGTKYFSAKSFGNLVRMRPHWPPGGPQKTCGIWAGRKKACPLEMRTSQEGQADRFTWTRRHPSPRRATSDSRSVADSCFRKSIRCASPRCIRFECRSLPAKRDLRPAPAAGSSR